MERIVAQAEEIAQLALRNEKYNVYLAKVARQQPLQLISRVGSRLVSHATGLGKALRPRWPWCASVATPRTTRSMWKDCAASRLPSEAQVDVRSRR